MLTTPRGLRLHIALVGRRNAGKSSLVNALTGQQVAIVSATPGTTTDPVEKPFELLPLGPVVFIDTAGLDDVGDLGAARVERSRAVLDRTDCALLVVPVDDWTTAEDDLLTELEGRHIPAIVVLTHADRADPDPALIDTLAQRKLPCVVTCAPEGRGINELRQALIGSAPESWLAPTSLVGDLVPPGGLAILVVPIDLEAPAGRLILPQVQVIRDLLDHDCSCLVVKERELSTVLARQTMPPDLVITDSQAFLKVAGDVPPEVPLTSFSILFARFKGDLPSLAAGTRAIENLRPGARILLGESCSHHAIGDDIGRVKIPRWLTQYVGGKLEFDHVSGRDFPADDKLGDYDLVVHCGACTTNRRAVLSRLEACRRLAVPMTNYGMCIAYSLGIFDRAMSPFPSCQ